MNILIKLAKKILSETHLVLEPGNTSLPAEGDAVVVLYQGKYYPACWYWGNEGDWENPQEDYRRWITLDGADIPDDISSETEVVWFKLPERRTLLWMKNY